MAVTTVSSVNYSQQWDRQLWREYVRSSGFKPYMGNEGEGKCIVFKRQLVDGGQTINVPFAPKLTGGGVRGAAVLRGAEEAMQFANEAVSVDYVRHAVSITRRDSRFVNFDLRAAARGNIKDWQINTLRSDIIDQFMSVRAATDSSANLLYGLVTNVPAQGDTGPTIRAANSAGAVVTIGGAPITTATEAQKNTWLANNSDRVLFGNARSNNSSNNHSNSLGNCDTTNDILSVGIVELLKRMARQANPQIKPLRIADTGKEAYVLFIGTRPLRDLRKDTTLQTFNAQARPRVVEDNPFFVGGDMLLDNVVVVEIPELPVLAGVGNGSADVAPIFLAGQEAVAYAMGEDMTTVEDDYDYEFERGVSMRELRGIKKIHYSGVQHGLVTGYVAAAADT